MSNSLPDDNLPPLPPSDDHSAPSQPPNLSPEAQKIVTPPNLTENQVPQTQSSMESPVEPMVQQDSGDKPGWMSAPSMPNPTSPNSSQPNPTNPNPLPSHDPIIAAPKDTDISQEAPFPGQPIPESEQEKLEQKAEDIVGETSASKAKKSKKILQVVVGVFAFLILGGGVLVGTNLVQLPGVGDVRQQAIVGGGGCGTADTRSECSAKGCLSDGKTSCVWRNNACKEKYNANGCGGNTGNTDPDPNNCQYWCGGCGGFCGDDGVYERNQTCNQQIAAKQAAGQCDGDGVQYGANYQAGSSKAACQAEYQSAWCDCNGAAAGGGYCFSRGFDGTGGTPNQCGELCQVVGTPGPTATPPGSQSVIYFCENQFNMSNGCQGRVLNSIPNCYCGTIQVDTPGAGFTSYESHCGCNTSTPPPTTPPPPTLACTGMTSVPTNPKLGDSVRYTCSGTAGTARINHYNFQYKVGNGAFTNLAASAAGSSQSAPLVISEPGSYTVRCRVCLSTDDTNCTAWQTL